MLDQAKLAVVAYGEVSGTDGTSTLTNSGVYTTRISQGGYAIDLSRNPDGSPNQQELNQFSDRDLIVVTPLGSPFGPNGAALVGVTNDVLSHGAIKRIQVAGKFATATDTDFSFIIYRTLTPPTSGGPA